MKNETDIKIPIELFSGTFDIGTIGTIGTIMACPHLSKDTLDKWKGDESFMEKVSSLKKEGILVATDTEITIDLTKKMKDTNTLILNIIKKYQEHINPDDYSEISEYLHGVESKYYSMGYEDAKIDLIYGEEDIFVSYGKKEDYE